MSVGQDQHRLERHAIGLPAVTAQSAALIAPAAGSVAGLVFIVGYSGAATPLAFLIGLLVCVCIALVIGEYARRLPSAGSFYTYLTRTFGPKTGFVTGVALFGAYLLLFPFQLDFFGNFVSSLLAASGVHIAWWVFSAALIVLSTTLGVLGVKPSLRTGLIGLGFEMVILTIFALVIIFKGGAAGNTIQTFDPSHSLKGSSGLLTAVVYTIFAFVGFESATTLGDEAREPRRTIPRAVMLTTLVVGVFYVIVSYAVTIGYGVSGKHVQALASAATNRSRHVSRLFRRITASVAVCRSRRSSRGMARPRSSAAAIPTSSYGLTSNAASNSLAAPANCDSTSTPGSSGSCAATYSFATRFIPSRNGVTSPTCASAYSGISTLRGKPLFR